MKQNKKIKIRAGEFATSDPVRGSQFATHHGRQVGNFFDLCVQIPGWNEIISLVPG